MTPKSVMAAMTSQKTSSSCLSTPSTSMATHTRLQSSRAASTSTSS